MHLDALPGRTVTRSRHGDNGGNGGQPEGTRPTRSRPSSRLARRFEHVHIKDRVVGSRGAPWPPRSQTTPHHHPEPASLPLPTTTRPSAPAPRLRALRAIPAPTAPLLGLVRPPRLGSGLLGLARPGPVGVLLLFSGRACSTAGARRGRARTPSRPGPPPARPAPPTAGAAGVQPQCRCSASRTGSAKSLARLRTARAPSARPGSSSGGSGFSLPSMWRALRVAAFRRKHPGRAATRRRRGPPGHARRRLRGRSEFGAAEEQGVTGG